jgi:hypothetical protein
MDPNACLERWRDCVSDNDNEGTKSARLALGEWLSKGGFWPQGMTTFEIGYMWRVFKIKPPLGYKS